MKKRMMGILLALSLCLTLLPVGVGAAGPATETADFTVGGGTEVIALLNTTKTGSAESTWDNGSNILTLRGIDFATTAATAVKLPAGSTIVLADGKSNNIIGGDAEVNETGGHKVKVSVYGIYTEGTLSIQGTGSLSVKSGKHTNTGNAWTYSTALYAKGPVMVEGGKVKLTGGEVKAADCAFSIGLELPLGSGLPVISGELTAMGGRSTNTENGKAHSSFTRGIDAYRSDVSVTGGKLTCRSMDPHHGLAWGTYILSGSLTVSGSAYVDSIAGNGIDISSGNLTQTGGKIRAYNVAGGSHGLAVEKWTSGMGDVGNITVSGGELDTSTGGIYMSQYEPSTNQGNFTMSGSGTTVYAGSIYGAERITISDAEVWSAGIEADKLTLQSGSLSVIKSVQKNEHSGTLYADQAIKVKDLAVNGGTLSASWYWGENKPVVFPVDDYWGYATPLVHAGSYTQNDGTTSMNGGTILLNTGCAGNTALRTGTLTLGENVQKTGTLDGHIQEYSDTPVVFSNTERMSVTVNDVTALDKEYDGTKAAMLTAGTVSPVAAGDTVSLGSANVTAEFASKDVGTDIAVTVKSGMFDLRGKDAYKYNLTTQPTDLSGLKANITYATAQDTTILAQTIRVGEGSSFRHPSFTGVGGETVTGMVSSYTYEINADIHVYNIAANAIPTLLNRLSAGDTACIRYTLGKSGNYKPPYPNGTIVVTMQARSGSTSSGSASYAVYVAESSNGSVTVSPKNASKGDTVTITIKPDSGYTLEALTVTDADGNELTLTDKGNGRYSFTMPASRVEVKATFMEGNSLLNLFYDVPNDAYYYEAVKWAVEQGVTTGIGNDAFGPELPCTRAQIVMFLWRAAGSPEPANTGSFSDVPSDGYYAKAVAWAIENGVTTGVGGDRFAPDDACTRAQAVTLLARARSAKAEGSAAFSDVPADSYYADAVAWAAASGITEGIGGGLFGPADDCTRAQIVTFLYRAYRK